MRLGGVAAHDDDEIRILDVGPGIRHRTTAECWGQTGHRWAVSKACLVVECQYAGAAHDLVGRPRGFIRGCGRSQEAGGEPAVDSHAVVALLGKGAEIGLAESHCLNRLSANARSIDP